MVGAEDKGRSTSTVRLAWWTAGLAILAGLVYLMATASTGPTDPTEAMGPRLEAITGFVAVVVLLLVLNWFVHKVYWSEWIGRHHRQRRKLLARTGLGATLRCTTSCPTARC